MAGEQPKVPHVCVVGAGVSGLRCADILLARGFQVTVLEARDRIGGRICQSHELGYPVDIGPNWIHAWGEGKEHPIYKIALETGTVLHHWNSKQLVYDTQGNPLPDEKADRLLTLLWEIIAEAFKVGIAARVDHGGNDCNANSIPKDESLLDFIKTRALVELQDEDERDILLHMSESWGAYVGEPVSKQSLRFAWMEECCAGEEMFVASNHSAIFDRIASPAKEKADILLGRKVISVTTPEDRTAAERVVVGIEGGTKLEFDEVVMTTPLGWLQRNLSCFHPALPPRMESAVQSLGLSHLEKVFITFPSAWWISDPSTDSFPSYTSWLRPQYAQQTNPLCWPQEVWNLAAFPEPHKHPTMLIYLYGDCSRFIVNRAHGMSVQEKNKFLDDFFRPFYSRLPGFNPDSSECKPKAFLNTEWLKDEFSGYGSYCNFQVGIEEADEDMKAIGNGCPQRRLWFCGEHTASFEECGTVAGAYLAGESVGNRIIEMYHPTAKKMEH